jgi:hypothetical protein
MTEEILPKKPRFEGDELPIAYDPGFGQWLVFSGGSKEELEECRDCFLVDDGAAMSHPLNREFLDEETKDIVDEVIADEARLDAASSAIPSEIKALVWKAVHEKKSRFNEWAVMIGFMIICNWLFYEMVT